MTGGDTERVVVSACIFWRIIAGADGGFLDILFKDKVNYTSYGVLTVQ